MIGAITGGGNDTYARLVGRHLGKHIPGNPTILPINMPGASGHISAAHIYTVAAKDGTAIGATTPGVITDPLWAGDAGKDKFNYDPTKLIHLGSAQAATYNCYVRSDAPVKKFEDAFTTELIIGAAQEGGSTRDAPVLLNSVLGTKFRVVTGYPGTREILVAIERNEVQGVCGMGWDAMYSQRPDWLEKGFIRVLVQENLSGSPMFDKMGVPKSIDFAKTPEDRQVIELAYSQQAFGRPYILPPGTPPERVAALRKAFMAATQDEELLGRSQEDARRSAPARRRGHAGAGDTDLRHPARDRRPNARGADRQVEIICRERVWLAPARPFSSRERGHLACFATA